MSATLIIPTRPGANAHYLRTFCCSGATKLRRTVAVLRYHEDVDPGHAPYWYTPITRFANSPAIEAEVNDAFELVYYFYSAPTTEGRLANYAPITPQEVEACRQRGLRVIMQRYYIPKPDIRAYFEARYGAGRKLELPKFEPSGRDIVRPDCASKPPLVQFVIPPHLASNRQS